MTQKSRLLRRALTGLTIAGLVALGPSWVAPSSAEAVPPPAGCAEVQLPFPENDNKVTLCHFTGSDSNPFIINEVSESAAESHFGHHGDCVQYSTGDPVCF